MQNEKITIEFNSEKYKALKTFGAKKGLNVNNELEDILEKLYQKYVPAPVKEYIETE